MKENRKRVLSLLLVLVMLAGLFPVSAFAEADVPVEFVAEDGNGNAVIPYVTVYDARGEFVSQAKGYDHHLAPGSYTFSAEADGYEPVENHPFDVQPLASSEGSKRAVFFTMIPVGGNIPETTTENAQSGGQQGNPETGTVRPESGTPAGQTPAKPAVPGVKDSITVSIGQDEEKRELLQILVKGGTYPDTDPVAYKLMEQDETLKEQYKEKLAGQLEDESGLEGQEIIKCLSLVVVENNEEEKPVTLRQPDPKDPKDPREPVQLAVSGEWMARFDEPVFAAWTNDQFDLITAERDEDGVWHFEAPELSLLMIVELGAPQPRTVPVTVNYVDKEGAALLPAEILQLPVAEEERTEILPAPVIDGYAVLEETLELMIPALQTEAMTATLVYVPGTTLTIYYVDTLDQALAETEVRPLPILEEEQTVTFTAPKVEGYAADEATLTLTVPANQTEPVLHRVLYKPEISYPELNYTDVVDGMVVTIQAPEGAFPEGTNVAVTSVEVEQETILDALDEGTTIEQVKAVDISFLYEGEKIEPKCDIHVSIRDQIVGEAAGAQLVHLDDEGNANLVTQADEETAADELSFMSSSFSAYVIIISTRVITAEGDSYAVELSYSDNAHLPAGSYLTAEELLPEDEGYQGYYDAVLEAGGNAEPDGLRLFDITVHAPDGEAVEPAAPVQISIRLDDPLSEAENYSVSVTHFVDGGEPESITPESGNQTAADAGEEESGAAEPASAAKTGGEFLRFETGSLSVYAVSAYQVTSDLDGRTFVIGRQNTGTTSYLSSKQLYLGRSLQAVAPNEYPGTRLNTALYGYFPNREGDGQKLLQAYSADLTEWTFKKVEGTADQYTLQADNGKYLNIGSDGSLTAGDAVQPLHVTVNGKYVRISSDGGWYVKNSSGGASVSVTTGLTFLGDKQPGDQGNLTLYEATMFDPVVTAKKVSVSKMVDGQNGRYLIYQNAYNPQSGKYEDFAIDGNGNLVKVYDNGDKIEYRGPEDEGGTVRDELLWQFTICTDSEGQPNGYYVLQNYATKNVLDPADGRLVGPFESLSTSGIRLRGRENNGYTSTMEKWNGDDNLYWGYQIVEDENHNLVLMPASGPASQEFSFAELVHETAELHTVATVDSTAHGIEMHLFDYNAEDNSGSSRYIVENGTGWSTYTRGAPQKGLTHRVLSNGLPVMTNKGEAGGSWLFGQSDADQKKYVGQVNHLFIQSIYDSTGYYEYSSFDNYARVGSNTGGNFIVYSEMGHYSPNTASVDVNTRGQFFPLNELNPNSAHTATAVVSGEGTLIPFENPKSENPLYGLGKNIMTNANGTNYYFGMSMGYDFMMPKDGMVGNGPMIYDFYGDDDLWVFVDGVLLLDLGGIHDALSGHIDFSTGKITGSGVTDNDNTIKKCFKLAGIFPDGTAWDDSKADQYFDGETFKDYGSHSFKMFYMESGAGASNLMMRFNMPVIEKGQFTVEKDLANTIQDPYANVGFAYQAFIKYDTKDFIPLVPDMTFDGLDGQVSLVYENTSTNVPFYAATEIGGTTYKNVFYLKPHEAASFKNLPENAEYYVQEIGISADYYNEIIINDLEIYGGGENPEHPMTEEGIYPTSVDTVKRRARVTYSNLCSEKNRNSLLINKAIEAGSEDNGDTFEFRVLMENTAGELVPYNAGPYYIKKDGHYYRYVDGQLVDNGLVPAQYQAGAYGTIAGIPVGFTVEIPQLLVDTAFYVDEIRLPSTWGLLSKEYTDGTYDEDSLSGEAWDYNTGRTATFTADGKIKFDTDAEVTFTNYRLLELTVSKSWNDANNQDGIRPSSVEVVLTGTAGTYSATYSAMLDGTPESTAPAAGGYEYEAWKAKFVNLPKYHEGTLIKYTCTETETSVITGTDGPGTYAYTVTGNATAGFTVTNTHTPETTTATVTKVWDDADNQDGIRPETLTLTLNGAPEGTTVPAPAVTKKGNSWTYTWSGLPKYENGTEIRYTVTENSVPAGYTVSGSLAQNGGTITNTHTPTPPPPPPPPGPPGGPPVVPPDEIDDDDVPLAGFGTVNQMGDCYE